MTEGGIVEEGGSLSWSRYPTDFSIRCSRHEWGNLAHQVDVPMRKSREGNGLAWRDQSQTRLGELYVLYQTERQDTSISEESSAVAVNPQ